MNEFSSCFALAGVCAIPLLFILVFNGVQVRTKELIKDGKISSGDCVGSLLGIAWIIFSVWLLINHPFSIWNFVNLCLIALLYSRGV